MFFGNSKSKKKEKEAQPDDGKKKKHFMLKKKTYVDYKGIEVEKEAPTEIKVFVKTGSESRRTELSPKMFSEGA